MRKLPILAVGLLMGLSACAPFAASNQLAGSLTPTATAKTEQPTATSTTPIETQEPTATATVQVPTEESTIAPTPGRENFQPQLEQVNIDLNEVVALLPPDAIPAVLPDQAREIMVTADEAEAGGIEGGVQVIGISINGESRAYPIPYLSSHEIVNDEVGGRLIAATW
jgi:hypothetical protein